MAEITYPTVRAQDLEQLLKLVHPDPHSALGAHPTPLGVIVRTYKPDARAVEVIVEGELPRSMMISHPAGLFELL
ncbi:MAG: GlgB N-terminal domain-containing protein, partial [Pyrinomonadaceae bacterium]